MSTTSKLSVILGVQGVEQVIADANKAKTALDKSLGGVQKASTDAAGGLNRVQNSMSAVAVQAAGVQGPLAGLSQALLALGPAGPVAIAVVAGMAVINMALNDSKTAMDNLRDATNTTANALIDLAVARGELTPEEGALQKAVNAQIEAQRQLTEASKATFGDFFRAITLQGNTAWEGRIKVAEEKLRQANIATAQAGVKSTDAQIKAVKDAEAELARLRKTQSDAEKKEFTELLNRIKAELAKYDPQVINRNVPYRAVPGVGEDVEANPDSPDNGNPRDMWGIQYTDAQMEYFNKVTEYANIASSAWTMYWEAVFSGANAFKEFPKMIAKMISQVARMEMAKNIAYGLSALGLGVFNPLATKSAGFYFASAAAWGALSGAASAMGRSSGGAGAGASNDRYVDKTMNNSPRSQTQIIISGDRYLDTTNPEKMDAFVRAIREAGQGNIIIRGA